MPSLTLLRIAACTILTLPMSLPFCSAAELGFPIRVFEMPEAALDTYVTSQAHPIDLKSAIAVLAPSATPRQLIRRLCGSDRPAYLKHFLSANNMPDTSLDKEISVDLELVWPACVFARDFRQGPPQTVTIRKGDTLADIHRKLTGRKQLDPGYFFLTQSTVSGKLNQGDKVRIAYVTLPSVIRPLVSKATFLSGMAEGVGKDWRTKLDILQDIKGQIVTSYRVPAGEEPSSCKASPNPPFNADKVLEAYSFSLGTRAPNVASVLIVDNGFFGADARLGSDAFKGSAFEMKYFRPGSAEKGQLIATSTTLSSRDMIDDSGFEVDVSEIQPLNFQHFVKPDEDSGHGTHVAGLAIGGPYFNSHRAKMPQIGGRPWVEMTIVNVGKGGSTLLPGAHREISNVVTLNKDSAHIVNMSLSYDDDDARSVFDAMVALSNKRTLYVAAAGNGGKPVPAEWVPATQGGMRSESVVTVSALDGEGGIAPFSSYSEDFVDLAAPGCAIKSWIANDSAEVELSGTSMAAPLVTFASSLVRSLRPDSDARLIKSRLIASGDLLNKDDRPKTMQAVALNIVKALYVDHDYLRTDDGEYLGDVVYMPFSSTQCGPNGTQHQQKGLWAFKRHETGAYIHYGRPTGAVLGYCNAQNASKGDFTFGVTHRIEGAKVVPLPIVESMKLPLEKVREVVFRMPP